MCQRTKKHLPKIGLETLVTSGQSKTDGGGGDDDPKSIKLFYLCAYSAAQRSIIK